MILKYNPCLPGVLVFKTAGVTYTLLVMHEGQQHLF